MTKLIPRPSIVPTLKWIPLALLSFAVAGSTRITAATPDFLVPPGAIQPGGDPTDNTVPWVQAFAGSGTGTVSYDSTTQSSNGIPGSLYITLDCQGGASQNPTNVQSANISLLTSLTESDHSGWLGDPGYLKVDLSQYASVSFDVKVNTSVSSNSDIPVTFMEASYNLDRLFGNTPNGGNGQNPDLNAAKTGWGLGATNAGWFHIVVPLTAALDVSDAIGFGWYEWYETHASTPPAHLEFWMDNIRLEAAQAPPPPPTLGVTLLERFGLMMDSALGEGGKAAQNRQGIDTVASYPWEANATAGSPVTYSMTITAVPDPSIYSNYEAHIFLSPKPNDGNPDNDETDVGWLSIVDNSDGTATASMLWKTNSIYDYTMFHNTQFGGPYGTNGLAAGDLGSLKAPTMLGTWSIAFNSDTSFTVSGPGGISTNLSFPPAWLASFDAANSGSVYAYFGADCRSNANQGALILGSVSVSGGGLAYALTNNFSTSLDTTVWGTIGGETVVALPSTPWLVNWSLPAAGFDLLATAYLTNPIPWVDLTANNASLPVPLTTYVSGTNTKALVATADLPSTGRAFFALRKVVATQLQVLMPGETSAPGTATGKTGTPQPQPSGTAFNVTVNAVDAKWNLVDYCTDTVAITSSDASASLPANAALAGGTGTFSVTLTTAGSQTVTATDVTQSSVAANTGSPTTVTQ